MKKLGKLQSNKSVEISTIAIVRNRCQFCYAFFKDPEKIAEHSNQCKFRFSETFEAFDGILKFACAVCFDVFQTRADLQGHERLHEFPGGFPCSICDEIFLNGSECAQHTENIHKVFKSSERDESPACHDCGAFFEQESYLRLHNETNCGRHRIWKCCLCCPNLLTEDAYKVHMESEHSIQFEEEKTTFTSKIEVSVKRENYIQNENDTEEGHNRIQTGCNPLFVVVKGDMDSDADAEINQSMPDQPSDDEFLGDENSMDNEPDEAKISNDDFIDVDENPESDKTTKRRKHKASEKKFVCTYCGRKFFAEKRLQMHLAVHGPDFSLVYKCDACTIYFKTTDERDEHKIKKHKDRLTCKICDKIFRTLKTLDNHKAVHHKKKKTIRDVGDTVGDSKVPNDKTNTSLPKKRRVRKNKNQPFGCDYCVERFPSSEALCEHKLLHGPDGSLVHACDCCNTYFASAEERDAHHADVHKEKLTCNVCDKYFPKYETLVGHLRNHAKRKYFICAKCGKSFRWQAALESHEQLNCGRPPNFECDVCAKLFANKATLTRHMINHTGERRHPCKFCDKSFRDNDRLTIHTRYRHSGERPHKCPHCDKCFVEPSSLKVHLIVHTGIKRYVCQGCGERYPTNSALHKHRNTRKDTCALAPIKPPVEMKS